MVGGRAVVVCAGVGEVGMGGGGHPHTVCG